MAILNGTNLRKAYAEVDVFTDVTISVPHGARIALVGPNGAGKSSLLRLLTGQEEPDDGQVTKAKGLEIGFLEQHAELALDLNATLWDAMLVSFASILQQEAALNEMATQLADDPALIEEYGEAQHKFEEAGGYDYPARIKRVLSGLGFDQSFYDQPVGQFSGGQKTRVNLGRLLLEQPDLLILDEPTNHLDIYAISWLESYLKEYEGALIVVSHDRYFLDNVANEVWEMVFGSVETYRGNYSHYVRQREERHAARIAVFEKQQEFIAKQQDYITRNIAGQNTRQAQGRRKRLERFLEEEALDMPQQHDEMRLKLEAGSRSGDKVIETEGVTIGYNEPLFDTPNILLMRGECAAIIGPNGAGKSTFLKAILDDVEPLAGAVRIGASVEVGYFAQAHEGLDPERTILDEILEVQNLPIGEARSYLANFLFSGDEVFKPIAALSGGERGRVALAKLALGGANLLLLDEPTNHLDITSQEILQTVLNDFGGTILLVSHDRYLIQSLATQIWAVEPSQDGTPHMTVFEGSYNEYASWRSAQQRAETPVPVKKAAPRHKTSNGSVTPEGSGLNAYMRGKRLVELEALIEQQEEDLSQLSTELEAASAAGDVSKTVELSNSYNEVEAQLDSYLQEWDLLQTEAAEEETA